MLILTEVGGPERCGMTTKGSRVLIVEDDVLLAMLVEDCLRDAGYEVVAVAACLQDALSLAQSLALDVVVLDVNLGGEMSFPVADVLLRRHIPFIICSSYDTTKMPALPQYMPKVSKPFTSQQLIAALAATHCMDGHTP
jgi:DNA-binding response OmpR family regulator